MINNKAQSNFLKALTLYSHIHTAKKKKINKIIYIYIYREREFVSIIVLLDQKKINVTKTRTFESIRRLSNVADV